MAVNIGSTVKEVLDEINNGTGGGVPFIPSSAFTVVAGEYNLATKWSVPSVGGVTEPTDGMIIAVRTPNGGAGGGVLLSIDGGSNYYPLLMNNNTIVKTVYSNNNTLILTFNPTATASVYITAGASTTVTGCWQIADYAEDNKVHQWHTTNDKDYPILFKYIAGTTSTAQSTTYTQYSNKIYVNPSTGTIYANDFVVGGQSIVGGYSPFTMEENNYSLAVGEEIDLEVYATDGMPQHIEIYVYQDVGNDQPLNLQLYNQAGDTIDIPYTYGGEYSIIVKPNGSNFDIYIRRANGGMTYLGSMCMEYIYLNSPSALDGVSHDTEIIVKYCWLNTIV